MKKHLRIVAQQCNFYDREKTLNLPEQWKEFHFNAEQLFHTHADMFSALYEESVHKELLSEYLQKSRDNDLETIIYMNCHILGPAIADRNDGWCVLDKDGNKQLFYDTYPGCCLNSSWRDFFFESVAQLKEFEIIGIFFDGPQFADCYCPVCQAKFEAMYNKKMTEASAGEVKRFTYESVLQFKGDLYKKVKSVNPRWLMYFNEGLNFVRYNKECFARQLATNDIIGTEGGFFFYSEPAMALPWRCAFAAKLAEAVANDRPTVIFFAGDHKPWSWYLHTPAETALCYMSSIGNGASVWYGLHCTPDNYYTQAGDMVKRLVAFDEKYDDFYQDSVSQADIALFYSYDTVGQYNRQSEESDLYGDTGVKYDYPGDYCALHGGYGILTHSNMAFDVITEFNLHDLKRYKVLVAPMLAMVSDEVRDAIVDFVSNGGVVIADGEFGVYDNKGKRRKDGAFAQEAGFAYTGNYLKHKRFNFCSMLETFKADNTNNYLPAPEWSAEVTFAADAQIIGRYSPILAGRYFGKPEAATLPFASKKSFGKGYFYYISGGVFELYYNFTDVAWRNAISTIIRRHAGNDYVLHNAASGVFMTVRSSAVAGTMVHLTNYTSLTRPIEKSAVQHDLILEVPEKFTRAVNIWTDKELPMLEKGKFALDPLEEVAVIKLDRS